MRRPALWPLARRLRASGFDVDLFPYATLWAEPGQSLARLASWMRARAPGPVHLVGHSLGGVTALALFAVERDLPAGRVVCIGSPINGSQAAARLRDVHLPWLAGRSRALLEQGVQVPGDREVGMIAGDKPVGAGAWFARFDGPHDGSVAVAETRSDRLAGHLVLPLSHSGTMFSRAVAAQTAQFLRHGRFAADDRG
ncbi:MAG: alpha/beta hydrolase [Xanthomonadales bacterium]|nr:alpha/beta hydrolase [Xanthomonadales bacterium]